MRTRTVAFSSLAVVLALLVAATASGWSFGVCGDSRDDRNEVFPRILAAVDRSKMEFLLHTGDLASPGGAKSWSAFRARTATFGKPLYLVIGNHELDGATREEFASYFGLPGTSYSFTHKEAHFALVDNAKGSLDAPTLDWLDKDLSDHPKGKNGIARLVVAMHIPPRTEALTPHGTKAGYAEQSEKLLKILKRHGVDLVLCSHEHMHTVLDWDGVMVIVSGGAGAPLVPLQRYGFYEIEIGPDGVRETFIPVHPGK